MATRRYRRVELAMEVPSSCQGSSTRAILTHACQLSHSLHLLLCSTPSTARLLPSQLLPLLLQIVHGFRDAINLLLSSDLQPLLHPPALAQYSAPVPSPPYHVFPTFESRNSATSPPAHPLVAPITASCKLQCGLEEENGLKSEDDPAIRTKRIKVGRPDRCSEIKLRNTGSSPRTSSVSDHVETREAGGSEDDINFLSPCPSCATDDDSNKAIDASGDDEDDKNSIRPLAKNVHIKRSCLPMTWTGRLPADHMDQFNDAFTWRKYGQKKIHGANHPRSYYRCKHKDDLNCPAKKHVQQCDDQTSAFAVTYFGNHTCGSAQQLQNQMAVFNGAPGSAYLPDSCPNGLIVSSGGDGLIFINETDSSVPLPTLPNSFEISASASTVHSCHADHLQHQFELEPAATRMHSILSPGVCTQDTRGLASTVWEDFAPNSISAQPIPSDFSFSESYEMLTVQELPRGCSKPKCCPQLQCDHDLHTPSSVESKENAFEDLKWPYMMREHRLPARTQRHSMSPVTSGISCDGGGNTNENLCAHCCQQAKSEATSLMTEALSTPFDFLEDCLIDMEG